MGCHTWTFFVSKDSKGELAKRFTARKYVVGGDSDFAYPRRKYCTNKSCEEHRQIVSYAEDRQGNIIGSIALPQ